MDYCKFCMKKLRNETARFCPHCGKDLETEPDLRHLKPGSILHGKYLLGAPLGEGGFGITYIGRDLQLDYRIAIKEFYPYGFANRINTISATVTCQKDENKMAFFQKGKERFLTEARILARCSGEPGIVDVRDFFEENDTAYIVMEYLEGVTLKTHLQNNGKLSADRILKLLEPVMYSLADLHREGIIHRDISPDNIMLVKNGVKLLDFGAARSVDGSDNKSLSVLLKPGFAPVEQYRSHGKQGPWTDVYALCATIYRCITGANPTESTDRIWDDPLQPPSALGAQISERQEQILLKGLAVRAEDRYQTIDEMLADLKSDAPLAAAPIPAQNKQAQPEAKPAEAPQAAEAPAEPAVTAAAADATVALSADVPLPEEPAAEEIPAESSVPQPEEAPATTPETPAEAEEAPAASNIEQPEEAPAAAPEFLDETTEMPAVSSIAQPEEASAATPDFLDETTEMPAVSGIEQPEEAPAQADETEDIPATCYIEQPDGEARFAEPGDDIPATSYIPPIAETKAAPEPAAEAAAAPVENVVEEPAAPKRGKKGVLIAVIAAVVLIGVVVGVLAATGVLKFGKHNEVVSETTTAEETTTKKAVKETTTKAEATTEEESTTEEVTTAETTATTAAATSSSYSSTTYTTQSYTYSTQSYTYTTKSTTNTTQRSTTNPPTQYTPPVTEYTPPVTEYTPPPTQYTPPATDPVIIYE